MVMVLHVKLGIAALMIMNIGSYLNLAAAKDHPKVGRGICYQTVINNLAERDKSCLAIQDNILNKEDAPLLNHTIALDSSFLVFHETENSTKTTTCQIAEAAAVANMIFDWICILSETRNVDVDTEHRLLLFGCDAGILSRLCYDPVKVADVLCDANADFNSATTCKLVHVTDTVNATCTRNFQMHVDVCSEAESKQDNDAKFFTSLSPLDAAACACAAFILVSWLIVMCVPDNKCKLVHGDDSHNTVPYRIYEIYGAVGRRGHAKMASPAEDFDSKQTVETEDTSSVASLNIVHMGGSVRRQSIC